jgi:tetratricopeptide (TPR) repeat protein
VRELTGIRDGHSSDEARAQIESAVSSAPSGDRLAANVALMLGLGEGVTTAAEIAWAVRGFLTARTGDQPLLVLIDDLQWAEPALLELLAALPTASPAAPILIVCLARPELANKLPSWETSIQLQPLHATETDELMHCLLNDADHEVRNRLSRASAGNPLFAEELAAWALAGDKHSLELPPSLTALLGARLDQLEAGARAVLERAAIEGEQFHQGAVVELSGSELRPFVSARLETLADEDLVRPVPSVFINERAFSFKHILIRDAAYRSTPKRLRASWHEQFADWLQRAAGERRAEYEEILGYHLEQSYRYYTELGPPTAHAHAVAARAARLLAAAGQRARERNDFPAAVSLLSRAADLSPPHRLELLPVIGDLLVQQGDFSRSAAVLDEAREIARQNGDAALETLATVLRAVVAAQSGDPSTSFEDVATLATTASVTLERIGNDAQLARVLIIAGGYRGWLGQASESARLSERALEHARRAGDYSLAGHALSQQIGALAWGPTPVEHCLKFVSEIPDEFRPLLGRSLFTLLFVAMMRAYAGQFAEARAACNEAKLLAAEHGNEAWEASTTQFHGIVELYAGNIAAAERMLKDGFERLGELGDKTFRPSLATLLAEALLLQGRDVEAEELLEVAEDIAQPGDFDPQVRSRAVRARILARRGDLARAQRLAQEAVEIAARTDAIVLHGDALLALAEVLRVSGSTDESRMTLQDAVELFERKENLVRAEQTRALLASSS